MPPVTIDKPRDSPSNSGVDAKSLIVQHWLDVRQLIQGAPNYTPVERRPVHTDQIADSATPSAPGPVDDEGLEPPTLSV